MAKANQRNYVQLSPLVPLQLSLEDLQQRLQLQTDAIHELNARIYFLQEQIAALSTATAIPVQELEDY